MKTIREQQVPKNVLLSFHLITRFQFHILKKTDDDINFSIRSTMKVPCMMLCTVFSRCAIILSIPSYHQKQHLWI